MHQEEFVYDEIASPREIMLVSRNVSYDDQNCRPSYGYSYDNIGNRKTAQEPAQELAYSPYGQAASTGDLVQPVQWSAEMHDEEPALVYYNYRFYNPRDGRWINRDPIAEEGGWNLYGFVDNEVVFSIDYLGKETNEFGYTMTIPAGYIPILLIIEGSISIEKKKNCVCIEAKLRTDVGIGVGIGLKIKQKWWPILPDIEYSLKTMISGLSNEKNT